MKENLISIKINKSVEEVFEFTVNPKNTHLWIDWIIKEWIESDKIKIWTIYKNIWLNWESENSYELIELENLKKFKLKSLDFGYEVTYFYNKIDDNSMILNYFEEMKDWSDLSKPFENIVLEKLKNVLEK